MRAFLLGFLFFPSLLCAEGFPSLRVTDTSTDLPTLAFYRDQTARFALTGTFPPGPNAAIVADFSIIANRIVAPIKKAIAVFPELHESTGTALVTDLELPLPKVEKPTRFVLVYRQGDQKIAAQKIEAVPEKAGDFIREFLAKPESERAISVFGSEPVFRNFLISNQLKHDDLGPGLPDRFATGAFRYDPNGRGKLFGLVATSSAVPHAILLLDPASTKPPGIYMHGGIALITLPLLAQLGTDPRAERTLVETLEILLSNP